jgi:hypothetical protein
MNERGTDFIPMYRDHRNDRLARTGASVGLLEPFESEDWNVDWPRPRSSDVSSLTVQTLIAQPSGATTSVWSEFSERVDAVRGAQWEELGALEAVRQLDTLLTGEVSGVVLAVQPRRVGARLQWRAVDAVVTLALPSTSAGVSSGDWQSAARSGANGLQPSTDRVKARALLKSWLAEDLNTSDRSMELLKGELDKDRESSRKLFS